MTRNELEEQRQALEERAKTLVEKATDIKRKLPQTEAKVEELEAALADIDERKKQIQVSALLDLAPDDQSRFEDLKSEKAKALVELSDWQAVQNTLKAKLSQLEAEQGELGKESIDWERLSRRAERMTRHQELFELQSHYIELATEVYGCDRQDYAWLGLNGFQGEMVAPSPESYAAAINAGLERAKYEFHQKLKMED